MSSATWWSHPAGPGLPWLLPRELLSNARGWEVGTAAFPPSQAARLVGSNCLLKPFTKCQPSQLEDCKSHTETQNLSLLRCAESEEESREGRDPKPNRPRGWQGLRGPSLLSASAPIILTPLLYAQISTKNDPRDLPTRQKILGHQELSKLL